MEVWKPIKNYESLYEVSSEGNIRRIEHRASIGKTNPLLPQRDKKLSLSKKGYLMVTLYEGQKQKHYQVHRLVAEAFIDNPNNLPQINHKDENKTNNSVSNLEWCTNKYNADYGTRNSRIARANTNGKQSKAIIGIKDGISLNFPSIAEASRQLHIARENIIAVLKGRRNEAGGYIWEYQF